MTNKLIIGIDIALLVVTIVLHEIFDLGWPAFLAYLVVSFIVTITLMDYE